MPGFDNPRLGGYTLNLPPDQVNMRWAVQQQVNQLADGSVRQRVLGYQFQADLVYDDNWIRQQDWTGLMAVANDTTGQAGTGGGTLVFVPRPSTYPSRTFNVLWINKYEFVNQDGRFWAYNGRIELVAAATTATISELM